MFPDEFREDGDTEVNSFDPSRFLALSKCWICGGKVLTEYSRLCFEFSNYREQDPGIDGLTGAMLKLVRCKACGFGQPEALPVLPRYFDRMYDQRWSDDWVQNEFDCGYKDFIFERILRDLNRMAGSTSGRLLDVGAHVGRFLWMARKAGWVCEGIELNPKTRAFAVKASGVTVHNLNAQALADTGARYRVITLIDVLEHIPDPVRILRSLAALLEPGGILAVKVPNGRMQAWKEHLRGRLRPGYRPTLADNLVHVNHFDPHSLALALRTAGFSEVAVHPGAPEEKPPVTGLGNLVRNRLSLSFLIYTLQSTLPSAWTVSSGLHLQAYAIR